MDIMKGFMPAMTPVALVLVGYIDPGKWATYIDVGGHFGGDLVAFALLFNFVGVLCHYLAARITVVTGRNLTQICTAEYDRLTCFFLGLQAEASVISLDLTMILGISHGLNFIFALDLFSAILLTALNAVLYPLFSTLLESSKARILVVCLTVLTITWYVLGMLSSLPEFPVSSISLVSKLSGESAFALMGLLGSNVMPHNFYLHSSIVQRYQGAASVSTSAWSQDNFILNFAISSGLFLVNYVIMLSAANAFYSTGLGLLSFQDAMSLVDQAYKNSVIPFTMLMVLFLANQIVASSWEFCDEEAKGGERMMHDFFNMDLPEWLHRATVRIFAVVAALFCLWHSGPEGVYHLLICTQVMVALMLPSSVIPLFRIASCRPIMGVQKISPVLEFMVLLTFIGMLVLELIFVVELIFGESEWVGNLRWSIGNGAPMSYILLLVTVCITLSIMLWLAATPLKSTRSRLDQKPWNWDAQLTPNSCIDRESTDIIETNFREEKPTNVNKESLSLEERSLHRHLDVPSTKYDVKWPDTLVKNLPDTIMENVEESYLSTKSEVSDSAPISHPEPERSATYPESGIVSSFAMINNGDSLINPNPMVTKLGEDVEKNQMTFRNEADLQIDKEDDGDTWDPEEPSKDVSGVGPSTPTDGPGSFRSVSAITEDGGNSMGSLSRLSGLGRAARRQLAAALDEFWGQLYDFHGQLTQDAKTKKLDSLLGMESKPLQSLPKLEAAGKEFGMQFQSIGGRETNSLMNSSLYGDSSQMKLQSTLESALTAQRGSTSPWSNQMQLLDTYMQSSNRSPLDVGERRYQSLRLPPSSESFDYQPATVHGYQLRSYLDSMDKERSDYLFGQPKPMPQKLPSLAPNNYRESLAFALLQKSTNRGVNYMQQPSSFQNQPLQRNTTTLQSDKPSYRLSAGPIERLNSQNNAKKYHSLPDIYGQINSPNTSMGFRSTFGPTNYDQSSFSSTRSRPVGPLAFDELSPSMAYRDRISYSSGANSLWSKQPFEQFGLGNDTSSLGPQATENRSSTMPVEPYSVAELECKLLQSFRHCILKLLKLEGSEWLFRANDGADEDLIDLVAIRERIVFEDGSGDLKQAPQFCDSQNLTHLISTVPHCGEGCVWKADLVISFGVWCIRRVLELSLVESRPELWGKYTYVLNRLQLKTTPSSPLKSFRLKYYSTHIQKMEQHQRTGGSIIDSFLSSIFKLILSKHQGVIDMAFNKPRTPKSACFCLQIPASYQTKSTPPVSSGMLPPAARQPKGKVTTGSMMLEIIKDVEIAISCRRGRSGTAAGDVAFPKGKENLASVLKRYKRRLSNRAIGSNDSGPGSRKLQPGTT